MKHNKTVIKNRKIILFEKYNFSDLQVLGKYSYNKAEDELLNHVHENMIEICYLDKGKQVFEVNNQRYLANGGDIFIHYPGEVHGSGGFPEEKGVLFWLLIKMEKPTSNNLIKLCEFLIQKDVRKFRAGKEVKKILEKIYLADNKQEPEVLKKIRLHLLAQSLLLELLDHINPEKTEPDTARLDKLVHYINENLAYDISIEMLAKEVNLSESRFKSLFKELTGFTPMDYIQRERVKIATERIKSEPELSLTKLAYDLNFSSPQYFYTVFKKYTGNSPGLLKSKKTE
ncbi:AraC family transcriptional regulator [Flavobacterium poyangense]|uniref:AraC family transcriptional regulator n=1 Tax=Flavobacterium poyangense TaxID=2204302 RepID=UPI001422E8B2|nr:AraC family transcriptional regulator [Flavobacterium sp. JXAS1]